MLLSEILIGNISVLQNILPKYGGIQKVSKTFCVVSCSVQEVNRRQNASI
ncbi:hypothetical protein M23134_02749 [Microscilla marina ATCC 23134]|uniref:Uncharacterized protein n=1 Tax=Microscilla marina ATCC 23134 TaxID=313606 RepID=A1ZWD9_MICM2|nr:hypothetical protein M23134_02749 [Microscilla marina ATCC 23134]